MVPNFNKEPRHVNMALDVITFAWSQDRGKIIVYLEHPSNTIIGKNPGVAREKTLVYVKA